MIERSSDLSHSDPFLGLLARFSVDPAMGSSLLGSVKLVVAGPRRRMFVFVPSDAHSGTPARAWEEIPGEAAPFNARCTISADEPIWNSLLEGSVSPQVAYILGDLLVDGEQQVAFGMSELLACASAGGSTTDS